MKPPLKYRLEFTVHNVNRTDFERCLRASMPCDRHHTELMWAYHCKDWKNVKEKMKEIKSCGSCDRISTTKVTFISDH